MINKAKFQIGSIVKHKYFDFRGVIFDVDPEFNNTEEWYQSIPLQVRPRKDQPFYHLLAEDPANLLMLLTSLNKIYYQMKQMILFHIHLLKRCLLE